MLKYNIFEPAESEQASLIVSAPKEDGSLRFCVDYRWLNAVLKRGLYSVPRMNERID